MNTMTYILLIGILLISIIGMAWAAWCIYLGRNTPKCAPPETLDSISNLDHVGRILYGLDEKSPPDLPEGDYYWDPNALMTAPATPGWLESDRALRNRITNIIKS